MSIEQDQEQFMLRGGQTTARRNEEQMELYRHLIREETEEFNEACFSEPLHHQVKECIDVIVVCIGFLFSIGLNPHKVWRLVWHNNMSKIIGKVKKDEMGKIQKSPESKARKVQMMDDIKSMLDDQ